MKTSSLAATLLAAGAVSAVPHPSRFPKSTVKRASSFLGGSTVSTFWGQSTENLSDVCDNGNFNVVIMSFITSLNPPKLNLGKDTGAASTAQAAKSGWELFDGTVETDNGSIADQISACQQKGIKVMIAFGGDSRYSNSTFSSSSEATQAADYLWYVRILTENLTNIC